MMRRQVCLVEHLTFEMSRMKCVVVVDKFLAMMIDFGEQHTLEFQIAIED